MIHEPASPQLEEEWLVQFKQYAQKGMYQQEPDFPWLLRRFEDALQQAQASIDPSFYPPRGYEAHGVEAGRLRLWRNQGRFPEVYRTYLALLTMTCHGTAVTCYQGRVGTTASVVPGRTTSIAGALRNDSSSQWTLCKPVGYRV